MWVIFAFLSAFFAGITSILAKCGIRKTDSNVATFIRTIVVLLFSLLMVAIVGSFPTLKNLSAKTILFLVLSGLSTGASWLCYFRALRKETSIKSYLSTSQVQYSLLSSQQSFLERA